ncbi:hypothetical protein [Catalinimonas niigatensis]|uniref:hypothetical protein n=1 Tax=Catalinimonas niigatensis TaxID=1397264 RepID=UPI002666A82B|nr:hypothetical protein [Catalinimonas niigatensis]WPP49045.1 hypothetical protein PZB72_20470 [Catalinimonas niigatensis]
MDTYKSWGESDILNIKMNSMYNWNKIPIQHRQYLKTFWHTHQRNVDFQLNELQAYQELMEERIQIEETNFIKYTKQFGNEFDIVNNYPNLFRSSFLVQTLALVEYQLREISLRIEIYNHQKFSISDLRGSSDLEKAKTYLKKTIELNFSTLNPEWSFLLNCYKLRNSIVHNQSEYEDESHVSKFVKSQNGLKIKEARQDIKRDKELSSFSIEDRSINDELLAKTKLFFDKIYNYILENNAI